MRCAIRRAAEVAKKPAIPSESSVRGRAKTDVKAASRPTAPASVRKSSAPAAAPRGRPKQVNGGIIRQNILDAAIRIFADRGLGGARIKAISKVARSNDRMIYYYFGSKEKLYIEVLETLYRNMTDAERDLALDLSHPLDALRR